MKVLIVEDELLISEQLEAILEQGGHEVAGAVQTQEDAEVALHTAPDLALIDLRLKNGGSGIALGEICHNCGIPFIYITANTEIPTMKLAVKTNPVTYISKPFKETDILAALELVRVRENLRQKIILQTPLRDEEVFLDDILYCEAEGSYTRIVTASRIYLKRCSLGAFLEYLNGDFVRIHRSYVVNKNGISRRTADSVSIGDLSLPVSASFKNKF